MADFIIQHWQLIASLVLALFNLVITLAVHRLSTARIQSVPVNMNDSSTVDALNKMQEAISALYEVIKNEKED